MVMYRGSGVLLATGLAWPYLVVTALTAGYAFTELDLPDPPWWSAGALLVMALGLAPLAIGINGRLQPDVPGSPRLRRCLLWTAALALVDALGVVIYAAVLNAALYLPLV
jgi:hypothetical protein